MNQAAELRGVKVRRWGRREWLWFLLALLPLLVLVILGLVLL
jgi:hypothetical protein